MSLKENLKRNKLRYVALLDTAIFHFTVKDSLPKASSFSFTRRQLAEILDASFTKVLEYVEKFFMNWEADYFFKGLVALL